MSNQKKTFFLCPTWDYHPDGPIKLGNIILSPSAPTEALNCFDGAPLTPDALFPSTTKTGVTWSKEKLHSGRYGLWNAFLTGLGVAANVSHDYSAEQLYVFDAIDTTEFIPTSEYLRRSMASPPVVSFLEKSRFRKHLYMITALKIARGARVKSAHGWSLGAEIRVDPAYAISRAPVTLGPEIREKWKGGESSSFDSSSDFVFAFRLRKIVIHRNGKITHHEYTKRAMYDEAGVLQVEPQDLPFEVEGLANEDASAQEFGCVGVTEVIHDDEECLCVQPDREQ